MPQNRLKATIMQTHKIYLSLMLFLLFASGRSLAQTTEGTEFWVTFMNNFERVSGDTGLTLSLIASSRQNTTVTVTNPQTGWKQDFTVSANQVSEFVVPHEQGYTYSAGTVEKRGLKVTSTAPISLYASNFFEWTYDATIVLPKDGLGKDYIVQVYENELYAKEFAIVATESNTQVTITPHAGTTDGKAKDVPYMITLQEGETYQVMSKINGSDFSGTRIQSDKPVAVFAGHQCINIQTGNKWCDHIVEQQMPVNMWGRQFALTKTYGQNGDRVMVTAKEDNTEVKVNGTTVTTLKKQGTYTFRLTDVSAFVETSQPVACYLYLEGAQGNNTMGDPASVQISPIEQRVQEMTFATFQTAVTNTHYVNVVTTEAGAAGMMLDGKSVTSSFRVLTGNSDLRFARIPIRHGTHTLRTSSDGFTGHVYGLGAYESYAYSFGSSVIDLASSILVNGKPNDGREHCYLEPVVFSPHIDGDYTSLLWKFGDGQTSSEATVTHTYAAPGDYQVQLVVTSGAEKDTSLTILHLIDEIRDTINVVICHGESYTFNGKKYDASGIYTANLKSIGGCDSIVVLNLTVQPVFKTEETATVPQGMSYRWHWKWYKEKGDYTDTLTSRNGCDSITILHLDVVDALQEMWDTICYRSKYTFMDYDYDLPAVDAYKNERYVDYTLEYRDLGTCLVYQMHLAIIPQSDGESVVLYDTIMVGSTYDFFGEPLTLPGTYTTTAEGASGCMLDYTLHLVVLPVPIHENYDELCHGDTCLFLDKVYTKPGQYLDTVWSVTGIVSIERLNLTDKRKRTEIEVFDVTSCYFGGRTLTEPVIYYDTLNAGNGCDSIVTLYLGVEKGCRTTHVENVYLCKGEAYTWNGKTYTESGVYKLYFNKGEECDSVSILNLSIDMDNMINQRWNDFLSVSKTAYDKYGGFTDYQWYKDDTRLDGETGSQLYLPVEGLDSKSGYSVEMTRMVDGKRIRTCPYYPVRQPDSVTLSVTPTVVSATDNVPLRIRTSQAAEARLYYQSGTHVATWRLTAGDNTYRMPSVRGLYMLRVQTDSGEQFTEKIIVE